MSEGSEMTTIYHAAEKTITTKVFVSCTCDWCGVKLDEDYKEPERNSFREFELSYTWGKRWPGASSWDEWSIEDLCDSCVDKLKKLLEDAGITLTHKTGAY